MVLSKINTSIEYNENIGLENEDEELDATVYSANFFDVPITIAIGNVNNTYLKNNIIFFPIYLVKAGMVERKIGYYEFEIPNENSKLKLFLESNGIKNIIFDYCRIGYERDLLNKFFLKINCFFLNLILLSTKLCFIRFF